MAPPPVFKGVCLQWLLSNLLGYEEAIKAGQGADFLCELVKRFVRCFPAARFAENVEPPKEWMDKDESGLPPKEDLIQPKKHPSQTLEDHLQEVEAFHQLAEHEVTTIMQVKNFMQRRVANGIFSFEKGGEAWNIVMAKLTGIPLSKPGRQRTAFNVWAKQNEALIDALVEKKRQELLDLKKRLSETMKDATGKDDSTDNQSKQASVENAAEDRNKAKNSHPWRPSHCNVMDIFPRLSFGIPQIGQEA
ncbi:hypothetical protein V5O48_009259 [Marasmius crinis-equi]|uniref:Uncharacterized protein n=1 Tax=Marasmius crinis-equi TaxID=585013 RepID=A0ABR3FBQ5_9AGAR